MLSESSATVAEAAHVLGVEPASIAKNAFGFAGRKAGAQLQLGPHPSGRTGHFAPATSAMLHNLSTLGISLRSMTDLLEQKSSL